MKSYEIKEGLLADPLNARDETDMLRRKMDELVAEMNQFTYIVSHDLQAPLRMITGFLELIDKRYGMHLDETGKQYIGHALKGSAKLRTLIFDLLDYSRISTVPMQIESIDLAEILHKVQQELAPAITTAEAQISADSLPVCKADRRLMTLLFHHLLDNAIKFRSIDIPAIRIESIQTATGVELSFRDNGIGIDPAFQEKIFAIFRRLHPDEQKYPGSGTGLAVCKKIVTLHGGEITVHSEAGKGSKFNVWLPFNGQ